MDWLWFSRTMLAMGDRIEDESSLLHWVAKHRIPMVIPGLTDGSIALSYSCTDRRVGFHDRYLGMSRFYLIKFGRLRKSWSDDWRWNIQTSRDFGINLEASGMDSAVSITTAPSSMVVIWC